MRIRPRPNSSGQGSSDATQSAADGIALHAARVRGGAERAAGVARSRADAAERPLARHVDVVTTLAQLVDDRGGEARLELDLPRLGLARVERAREVVRMEHRQVDRGLEVRLEEGVVEKEDERPLILLVTARGPEREHRAIPSSERRRERRARTLPRFQGVGEAFLEPEHLRAGSEREAELGHDRRALQPAPARGRGDDDPEAVDDVEVARVAASRLAGSWSK